MHRILFEVGGNPVYTYGVLMAIGIIVGVGLTWYLARKQNRYSDEVIDFALWAVIFGIIGSRLSYVIPRWDLYAANPMDLFAIWQGGLTIQGGLIGGLLAGIVYTKIKGIKFWYFADLFAPGMVLGQAMGRIGCYFFGCSFGVPTNSGWGLVFPEGTDAFAIFGAQALYPTQMFEFVWDIAILALILIIWQRRRFDGFAFLLYFALWNIGTAVIRFWRGDIAVDVSGITGGQVVGFSAAALAIVLFVLMWRRVNSGKLEPATGAAPPGGDGSSDDRGKGSSSDRKKAPKKPRRK